MADQHHAAAMSRPVIARYHLQRGEVFDNVFSSFREYREQPQAAEFNDKVLESTRTATGGRMDSHPTYSERLAAVDGFDETRELLDLRRAIDLLADVDGLEQKLTRVLTQALCNNLATAT